MTDDLCDSDRAWWSQHEHPESEAVREGWLAPPVLAGGGPPPRQPVMTLRGLVQDLQQDREGR
jgi:hypothetical protein